MERLQGDEEVDELLKRRVDCTVVRSKIQDGKNKIASLPKNIARIIK
jgi:hypothetical protein